MNALYIFGFLSRKRFDVQIAVKVCGPPSTSYEFRTVCTSLSSSCMNWNGGTLNAAVICAPPLSSAIVASGGVIEIDSGSSFLNSFGPHCLAAAICRVSACTEVRTAGTAMRSLSVKSAIVLIAGLRALSRNGCDDSAEMPRTSCGVPLVRAQRVNRPGTPPEPMSTLPEMSASLTAVGPLNLNHDTLGSATPRALAYNSNNNTCCITLSWR